MYLRFVVKLFLGNRSGILVVLPFVIAIYVACNLYMQVHLPVENAYFGFWGPFLDETNLVSQLIAPVLIFFVAIVLNVIFNRQDFREKNTYVLALVFVVAQSFFHHFYYLTGFGIAQLLLALSMLQIFRMDQNTDGRKQVFNASFLMGVAMSFYPPLLVGIPFVFTIIWVLRPFVFRESALMVVGIAVPLVYAGVFVRITSLDLEMADLSHAMRDWRLIDLFVVGGAILLMTFIAIPGVLQKISQSSIRLKKLFRIIVFTMLLVAAVVAVEILLLKNIEPVTLVMVPLAFILSYSFGTKKQYAVPTAIFYILFIFSVGKFFFQQYLTL